MIASIDWEGLFCGFLIPTLFMVVLQLWAIFDSGTHPVTSTSDNLSSSIYQLALLAEKIKPEWPYDAQISTLEFQGQLLFVDYPLDGLSLTNEFSNRGIWFFFGNSVNCYVDTIDKGASDPGMLTSANPFGAVRC